MHNRLLSYNFRVVKFPHACTHQFWKFLSLASVKLTFSSRAGWQDGNWKLAVWRPFHPQPTSQPLPALSPSFIFNIHHTYRSPTKCWSFTLSLLHSSLMPVRFLLRLRSIAIKGIDSFILADLSLKNWVSAFHKTGQLHHGTKIDKLSIILSKTSLKFSPFQYSLCHGQYHRECDLWDNLCFAACVLSTFLSYSGDLAMT